MKIQIVESEVLSLNVSRIPLEQLIEEKDKFKFSFTPEFEESKTKGYYITFSARIPHRNGVVYETEYRSEFKTNDEITEEFKNSKFMFINSPAIAYPFFRAFVANMMLVSGHEPMMLPTVNFVQLFERKGNYHEEELE
ncbi:protein-export chaperone SecB [Shewanella septentrionalis]|uniref:Protein-export chaperone SecB n=1 Tax=Shewanella septentrionalis TaxID=2952223 RepID=A0A9X2WR38_9GAMM|nr:protein-export chaperone SecB [Shewanella septentrionalis]MCT7944064.1 protein-export chaperone SecB [Shewanella septentrionalis]